MNVEDNAVKPPITRAILAFKRDTEDKNWISKLPNHKTVMLHRRCDWEPQPGVEYVCSIDEQETYALAWITAYHYYPRIVITPKKEAVLITNPDQKELIKYPNPITLLEENRDIEEAFIIYKKRNKDSINIEKIEPTREIEIAIKILDSGMTITKNLKLQLPISKTAQDIVDSITKV